MKSLALRVAFALSILPIAAHAQTDTATVEKLRKELIEVETATDQFRRLIPAELDLSAKREVIDQLARRAELAPVDVKVLPGTERPPLVMNRLEIHGPFEAVHFFLSMLRIRALLVGIESARFDAGPGETVRYVIRLAYPTWADVQPEVLVRSDPVSMMRQKLERDRAVRDEIVATVARLQEDPLDALAVFTKAAEEHAIALTSVRVDDGISIEGLLLGAAARNALAASMETAKLSVSRTEWSRAGACQAFSVAAARSQGLPPAEFTPASPLFDGDSATFCAATTGSAARDVVVPGAAPYFLRLRDVDLHDLFFVLNDLLPENFVVDEDVKGRINLDAPDSASIDDLFDAISSTSLFIGPGPLRRVTTSKPPAAATAGATGEPINVSLRHAHLSSILCLLGEVSAREIRMPLKSQRRLSLFATELPVGVALDRLAPGASADAVNACAISTPSGSRLSRRPRQFEQLGIDDLRIAGLALIGVTWRAYVYAPGGRAMAIEAGQRLFDGKVQRIGPESITFASDGKGIVEVPLVP